MKFSLNASTVSALHLNRELPQPREQVFKAFVQPELLSRFWLADGAQAVQIDCEPKEEGEFRVRYQMPSGGAVEQEGVFRQVVRNEMLVLNLGPDSLHEKEGGTLVTLEFRKAGRGCALSVTHEGLADGAAQERARKDWLGRLERLQAAL